MRHRVGQPNDALLGLCLLVIACLAFAACSTLGTGASPAASAAARPVATTTSEADDDGDQGEVAKDNQGHGNKAKGNRFGGITITAVNGSHVSLATEDGWTRTIEITAETKISRGETTANVSDLKVGDEVQIRQRRNADGSFTIVAVVVRIPRAAGEVTAIDGNSITIKARGGTSVTVNVTGSTTYRLGPNPGSKADIKVGTRIAAEGERGADGSIAATSIRIALAELGGEVTAKSNGSITLKLRDGSTRTVHVGAATKYKIRGSKAATPSLADIAIGNRIEAEGTLRADGSLDAIVIQVGKNKQSKPAASPGG